LTIQCVDTIAQSFHTHDHITAVRMQLKTAW